MIMSHVFVFSSGILAAMLSLSLLPIQCVWPAVLYLLSPHSLLISPILSIIIQLAAKRCLIHVNHSPIKLPLGFDCLDFKT